MVVRACTQPIVQGTESGSFNLVMVSSVATKVMSRVQGADSALNTTPDVNALAPGHGGAYDASSCVP